MMMLKFDTIKLQLYRTVYLFR